MKAVELNGGCSAYSIPRAAVSCRTSQAKTLHQRAGDAKPFRNSRARSVLARVTTEAPSENLTEGSSERFNWFKHWWPVQLIYNLDTDRPNRTRLLGEYFVAWKSKSGDWVAMRDMCPHRLAPLSEGRVESDGTLMCSYHGWRFDESGKCVKIPQADDEKSHEAACNNPRSCAATYPCKVRGGILWIWPDHSETRHVEASASSVSLSDDIADYMEDRVSNKTVVASATNLPYDYTVLVENLLDPAHVPFSHHGTDPSADRARGGAMRMRNAELSSLSSILAVTHTDWLGNKRRAEFIDGSLINYSFPSKNEDASPGAFLLLVSPLEADRCRIFGILVPPGALSGRNPKASLFTVIARHFSWLIHLRSVSILDGDTVILHTQGAYMRQLCASDNGLDGYFMPTSSDLAVQRFRKWLSSKAGGGPFGASNAKTFNLLPKRELLDRHASHLGHCKICQEGLSFVNRMIGVCKFLRDCSVALGGVLLFQTMQYGVFHRWRAAAAAALFVVFCLIHRFFVERLLPQFHFVDYIHAEKN